MSSLSSAEDVSTTRAPARKAARTEAPTENPNPACCNYYLARKRRFCRTERRPGSVYCHTHASEASGAATEDRRVPCPINPNHTVYASRLARHVRVCPDLRFVTVGLPYYAADAHANRGVPQLCPPPAEAPRVTHRDLSSTELSALEAKVLACYAVHVAGAVVDLAHVADPPEGRPAGVEPDASMSSGEDGEAEGGADEGLAGEAGVPPRSRKHGPQHAALLQCLRYTLAQSSLARATSAAGAIAGFVELGAGKGGLAVALQALLAGFAKARSECDDERVRQLVHDYPFLDTLAERPRIAVIDMDGFRRKGDARVRRSALPLDRLRINIKDLDLATALRGLAGPGQWAALGKHLCGACTDFALSCAVGAGEASGEAAVQVSAMVIATCCHQRCELRHLNPPAAPGPAATDSGAGVTLPVHPPVFFTGKEFAAMTSMSSWAVCGDAVGVEKRAVGYACKRVIDELRVAYLRRAGFTAMQCRYTTTDVTGENVCILAWR